MILRNFRELDAEGLHPEPSLRKIREADGDSLGLRILRRQWHPTPVLLPEKSHGWRSLVG